MQNTAAIVFQGEAGGATPRPICSLVDTSTEGHLRLPCTVHGITVQCARLPFSSKASLLSALQQSARQLFGVAFIRRFVLSLMNVTSQATETLARLALWYVKRHKGIVASLFCWIPRSAMMLKGCGRDTKITFSESSSWDSLARVS